MNISAMKFHSSDFNQNVMEWVDILAEAKKVPFFITSEDGCG